MTPNTAPAKDPRAEKIRKHLREGAEITKSDFLDFVRVYPYFHQAGYVARPDLTKWIEKNIKRVRQWLPEIWEIRPDYFGDRRPESRYAKFEQYDKLVSLGLTGRPSGQSGRAVSPDLGGSDGDNGDGSDNDTPLSRLKGKGLSDFGTPVPEPAVRKRPALSGAFQQQVWLEDIKEAQGQLGRLKRKLLGGAKTLLPDDEFGRYLRDVADSIPDMAKRVETAQLCLDQVQADHDAYHAEKIRRRAELPRDTPAPEVHVRETVAAMPDEPMSIRVESDIVPPSAQSARANPRTPGRMAQFAVVDSPQPSASSHPTPAAKPDTPGPPRQIFARRSAPSKFRLDVETSRKRKAGGGSSISPDNKNKNTASHESINSSGTEESSSETEFPEPKDISSSATAAHRTAGGTKEKSVNVVYDVDSADKASSPPRPKRLRPEFGNATRPSATGGGGPLGGMQGGPGGGNITVPEAVMG